VYRVPAGRSLTPDSACPKCGTAIRKRDNIPVISWLMLRGKCRGCAQPISARYPLVEAGTAIAFVLVTARFGPALADATTTPDAVAAAIELVAFLVLTAVSIALALIDLDTKRLPNVIVVPSLLAGVVLLGVAALVRGDIPALIGAGVGGAGLFLFYFVLALVKPGGMGFGDVKLAAVLGLYLGFLGWGNLLVGAFAAFLFGGVFGLVLILIRRAGRKTGIPFGPWMILGAWLGVFAGEFLASSYFGAVGVV
jgi:leader peptidase (prepilin peptidase)/N-methyltransferase